jgi:UDP-N-acetylglucosamine acyltransferase
MATIHPTAIVGERVTLGSDVRVGPFAIIEDDVVIGDRCVIGARAQIGSLTEIGPDNQIGVGAVIGGDPQILGWEPVDSRTVIGSGNVIREYATVHRAKHAGDATVIGDDNFIMAVSHIAHDCQIGNRVVICNGALVAGHVTVGDRAFISGNCPIHQFVRIGRFAMIRGLTAVGKDVVPFTLIDQTNTVRSLNLVGLRRSGLPADNQRGIREAYRVIFRTTRPVSESLKTLEASPQCDEVREIIDFIRTSERGICLAHSRSKRISKDEDAE